MSGVKIFIGVILVTLHFCTGNAQSVDRCYDRFVKEALEAQQQLNFDLAIYKLEAAEICPDKPLENNLGERLKLVNEAKIRAITDARDRARLSEEKAVQQLTISESNRLAFLANQEREKGNVNTALKLAYRAMEIAGDRASVAVQRAFGDAVYRATLKELSGHRQSVRQVAFSGDSRLLLTVSNDSSLIIWKNNGEQLTHFPTFFENIQSAYFSPDGKNILTASGQKVQLWDLQGQRLQELKGHVDLVYEAVFSHDGQMVATCSRDQIVNIWNAQNGKLLRSCRGATAAVTKVQFSPNDAQILGLSADKCIRIWNVQGALQQEIKHQQLYFGGAAFGPQEGQVLTFTADNALQIWDIESGRMSTEIKVHQGMIRQVLAAPDQMGFISCSTDRLAILYDVRGQEKTRLDDHIAAVDQVVFSVDGHYVLTGSMDGSAKLYDPNGQLLMDISGLSGSVNGVAISPDNQQIVKVGESPIVYLCQNPQSYYSYLKKNPPEAFTADEKEKYAIEESTQK